jgi:myo-inositol-1(or 4)-monophosphatase
MNWTEILNFVEQLTQQIGNRLIEDFGKLEPIRKEDGTLVTKADRWADETIRSAIIAQFPTHAVLSEETEHFLPDTDWCWVVDPIDGTTNFTRGIPIWGICLGLLYRGTPVFGFVRFPQIGQTFHGYWYGDTGLKGPLGAFLNGLPIHTSKDNPSHNHLFNICARSTDILKSPFPCKIRAIGVASYNVLLVACGAALGGTEATPKIWDIAAVLPILEAAGGCFVSLETKPVFPLAMGQNYGNRSFPLLIVSRQELIPIFKPLVAFLHSDPSS